MSRSITRLAKIFMDYALGNRIGLLALMKDRLFYYVFFCRLYKRVFRYYGTNVKWGRHGHFKCIPKSVRINSYSLISIGDDVQIDDDVYMQAHTESAGIDIGKGCRINAGTHIQAYGRITIGEKTLIAPGVLLSTSDHCFERREAVMSQGQKSRGDMVIGTGCWIGRHAHILGGVNIADFSVVAAQAVITKGDNFRGVFAGNPARIIKELQ